MTRENLIVADKTFQGRIFGTETMHFGKETMTDLMLTGHE